LIQRLKSDPGRFLGPVLVGNNLVNIAISSIATAMAISLLYPSGRSWFRGPTFSACPPP
jgi:Mg2+/Co2+ transporter CorB